jgi:hypothetical protein
MDMVPVGVNSRNIAVSKDSSQPCTAFPDVCFVPAQPQPVFVAPYPTGAASGGSSTPTVKTPGGNAVLQKGAAFKVSKADEAGTAGGGIVSSKIMGKAYFTLGSSSVFFEGASVVAALGIPPSANAASGVASAALQLRTKAGTLHAQLVNMPGANPGAWHAAINEYIQTLSKLYILLNLK